MSPLRKNRPTSRDVARLAGVSHMTVSRVVRGLHCVDPETSARVLGAIEKLGYQPDPALSALAAYRASEGERPHGGVLALLDCDGIAYSQIVFQGVWSEAKRLGYQVEYIRLAPGIQSQKKVSQRLFNCGIHGLLFGPAENEWEFSGWDWSRFAPVSLSALPHKPDMPSVAMDYFHGAMTACHLLQKQGCKRIGLAVSSDKQARTGQRWLGGYFAGLGGKSRPRIHALENARDLKIWALQEKLDGVLTAHEFACTTLQPLGIRLAYLNSYCPDPEIPRLEFDPAWIGIEGVRFVHHLLLSHEFGLFQRSQMLSVKGRWMVGTGSASRPVEF